MTTKRRTLRRTFLSIIERRGVLCTIASDKRFEDELADAAIAIMSPKKTPRKKRSTGHLTPIAYALADVCRIDFKANRGRLFKEAERLYSATPQPNAAMIQQHYGSGGTWYERDWRGKKNHRPTLAQVRETWLQLAVEEEPKDAPNVKPAKYSNEWYEQKMASDVQLQTFKAIAAEERAQNGT
jgi:hypothetical protein